MSSPRLQPMSIVIIDQLIMVYLVTPIMNTFNAFNKPFFFSIAIYSTPPYPFLHSPFTTFLYFRNLHHNQHSIRSLDLHHSPIVLCKQAIQLNPRTHNVMSNGFFPFKKFNFVVVVVWKSRLVFFSRFGSNSKWVTSNNEQC